MKTHSRFWRLVIGLVLLNAVIISSVSAETETSPLLEMLRHVPDTAVSRMEIFFNDRRAIEAAYPPARIPADWAEFRTLSAENASQPDMMPLGVWWRVFYNQASSRMTESFLNSGEMPEAIGIDFFDIGQELNYGEPPESTLQIEGQFDLEAVRAALTAQGYIRQDRADPELWCSADGCDAGSRTNLADQNPSNPFGGNLGRKQPILIENGRLISSPSLAVIEAHIAVTESSTPSLADAPEYQAAVTALSQDATLLQAYFWDGEILARMGELDSLAQSRLTPAQLQTALSALLEDYETLPPYQLLAFGDTVTETEQVARMALVYSDDTAAQQAANLIPKRIAAYQSVAVRRPFTELLEDRRVAEVGVEVVKDDATSKYLVLLTFATPKATPDQILILGPNNLAALDVTAPGLVYRLLVDAAFRADLGWLSTVSREDIEKIVNGG